MDWSTPRPSDNRDVYLVHRNIHDYTPGTSSKSLHYSRYSILLVLGQTRSVGRAVRWFDTGWEDGALFKERQELGWTRMEMESFISRSRIGDGRERAENDKTERSRVTVDTRRSTTLPAGKETLEIGFFVSAGGQQCTATGSSLFFSTHLPRHPTPPFVAAKILRTTSTRHLLRLSHHRTGKDWFRRLIRRIGKSFLSYFFFFFFTSYLCKNTTSIVCRFGFEDWSAVLEYSFYLLFRLSL